MNTMNPPLRIKVIDILGSPFAVAADDGAAVYNKISAAFTVAERPVELDFTGMDLVISAFLNTAIGRFAAEMSLEEIRSRISITGLAEDDVELVNRVLENAVRYYADPDQFRKALELDDDDDEEQGT